MIDNITHTVKRRCQIVVGKHERYSDAMRELKIRRKHLRMRMDGGISGKEYTYVFEELNEISAILFKYKNTPPQKLNTEII